MRISRVIVQSCVILGITLALFVAGELALRLLYPNRVQRRKEQVQRRRQPSRTPFQFNPTYLVSLKPGMHMTTKRHRINGGDLIPWQTNTDGFRGPELRQQPSLRIMVYGDSNIQARFSRLEKTFPYRLQQYLQQPTRKAIEVINAGIAGFGPDQSVLKFAEDLKRYHPDMIILHIFADNDFGDIVRNRLVELGPSGEFVITTHTRKVDALLLQKSKLGKMLASLNAYLASLLMVRLPSKAVKKILGITKQHEIINEYIRLAKAEMHYYHNRYNAKYSHFGDHYDIDVAVYPNSASSQTKISLMNAVLQKAETITSLHNIEFMVLIQPSVVDLTTNFRLDHLTLSSYKDYHKTNLTSAVEKLCLTNGIKYLNLFGVFARNSPESLFFRRVDNHWNDAGQDLAAQETAHFILRRMLPFCGSMRPPCPEAVVSP